MSAIVYSPKMCNVDVIQLEVHAQRSLSNCNMISVTFYNHVWYTFFGDNAVEQAAHMHFNFQLHDPDRVMSAALRQKNWKYWDHFFTTKLWSHRAPIEARILFIKSEDTQSNKDKIADIFNSLDWWSSCLTLVLLFLMGVLVWML